jgi:ketosteroid isomerase-like protein
MLINGMEGQQMKKLQMKKLVGTVLFTCVCAGLVLAQSPKSRSNDASVADTLKQLEQDMGNAMVAADTDKINQILADDWSSLGSSGRTLTREGFLSDLKSGNDKLESFEIGPTDVKVMNNVAVVQAMVTEKRTDRGQDTSGHGTFLDVFEKRGDKWVMVRSHSSWVKNAN